MGAIEDQDLTVHIRRNHRKKEDHLATKWRMLISKYKINSKEIYQVLDATHVMRRDTTLEIVLETKVPPTISRTRKYIMLRPLKMMKQR